MPDDQNARPQEIALPRSTFSTEILRNTDDVDAGFVSDAWIDAMSVFFNASQIADTNARQKLNPRNETRGTIDNFLFPGFMSIRVTASGQHFTRGNANFARDSIDGLVLQYYRSGGILSEAGGDSKNIGTGDLHLVDMTRHIHATASDFDAFNLLIPRTVLEAADINMDNHHTRRLAGDAVATRILARHMQDLHLMAEYMTPNEAAGLVAPTVSLLRAALDATPEALAQAQPAIDRGRLQEIRTFVDRHLQNPALSPDMIAHALGMSRATLYRLAAPLGGIQRFVTNRRVRHAFRLLTSPDGRNIPLIQLAFDLGFQSESTFRRAFREAFGMAPAEARDLGAQAYVHYHAAASRERSDVSHVAMGDTLYKKWVADLLT